MLTYDLFRIRIRTNLFYEIRIRRMQIFLGFVTSLPITDSTKFPTGWPLSSHHQIPRLFQVSLWTQWHYQY